MQPGCRVWKPAPAVWSLSPLAPAGDERARGDARDCDGQPAAAVCSVGSAGRCCGPSDVPARPGAGPYGIVQRDTDEYRHANSQLEDLLARIRKLDQSYSIKTFVIVILVFCFLIGVEALFNSQWLMQIAGVIYDHAKLIAAFIYLLLFACILFFKSKIDSAESPLVKNAYRTAYALLIGTFLIFSSYARTKFASDDWDWVTFIGVLSINCMVLFGLIYLHQFLPSKQQFKDMFLARKLNKEQVTLEARISSLKTEINQQAVSETDVVKSTQENLAQHTKNRKFLEGQYSLAASAYMEQNIKLRSDRLVPLCFEQLPPLNLS